MNMQIAGTSSTPGAVIGTFNADGTLAAPAGGEAFSSALGKVLQAGDETDGSVDALTLTLAALLGGMFPTMAKTAQAELPGEGQLLEAIGQVQALLSAHPELLEQLTSRPDMQMWLNKAQALLQEVPAPQVLDDSAVKTASDLSFEDVMSALTQSKVTPDQAKQTIEQLLQTVKTTPDNALLAQLAQELTEIVKQVSPTAGDDAMSSSADAATVESAAEGNAPIVLPHQATSHKKFGLAGRSVLAEAAGTSMAITVKPEQPKSKLELLAAKAVMATPFLTASSNGAAVQTDNSELQPIVPDVNPTSTLPFPGIAVQQTSTNVTGEEAPIPTTAGRFVQDLGQFVLSNLQIIEKGGLSEAKLSLTPAHLGHVDVKITMQDGQVVAHFMAQTASGKEMLESQLPQLRVTLQNLGLQVERLDVTQSAGQPSGMFQEQRGQQSFQQSSKQRRGSTGEFGIASEDFAAELQSVALLRNQLFGNQFNVTA